MYIEDSSLLIPAKAEEKKEAILIVGCQGGGGRFVSATIQENPLQAQGIVSPLYTLF